MGNCYSKPYIEDEEPPCPPRIVYTRSRLTKLTGNKVHPPVDKSIWKGELLDLALNHKDNMERAVEILQDCNNALRQQQGLNGGPILVDNSDNTCNVLVTIETMIQYNRKIKSASSDSGSKN